MAVYEVKPGWPKEPIGRIYVCSDCARAKYKDNDTLCRVNLKSYPFHRKMPCEECGKPMTRR